MNDFLSIAGVTAIVSLLFTLVFQYAPVLNTKWAGLKSEVKKLVVLGLYLVVGAFVAFGGCVPALLGFFPALLCVAPPDFLTFAFAVLVAVGAGQGVYGILPETAGVAAVKADRLGDRE